MIWKFYKDGEILLECELELMLIYLKRLGENILVRIIPEENTIVFLSANNEIDRSELIRNGINKKNNNKYKRKPNYKNEVGYKFCTQCERSKPISEFGLRKSSADGRHRICRKCYNRNARKRREKNKERGES